MIDAKRINEIIQDCLFKEEEVEDGKPKEGIEWIPVKSVSINLGLVKERVEKHKEEIIGFLNQLDDHFKKSGGGGWTFLNACMDKNGFRWGEQINVDELIALGIAIGLVSFPMPRESWKDLPGGVPYIVIDL